MCDLADEPGVEDLMRVLALPAASARAAGASHYEGVDFDTLGRELARQRLLGLLGSRMIEAGTVRVQERFRDAVHVSLENQRERAGSNAMLAWSLLSELEADGIRVMPLKGPFLAQRLHGDVALRESEDIDLLVSPWQMPEAIATLERIGAIRPRSGDKLPALHHHFVLGASVLVELHWRIYWYDRSYTERFLARAIRRDGLWVPSPADELISLLLYHARDGLVGLRIPADIAACWQLHHDQATIEEIRRTVQEFPLLTQPVAVAAQSVERVLGLDLATKLGLSMTKRSAIAVELTDWAIKREPREIDTALKLVDGLTASRAGFGDYLRRAFLPRLEGRSTTRWFRRLRHATDLTVRFVLAGKAIAANFDDRRGQLPGVDPVHRGQPIPLRCSS